ncbi:MAG: hypothetical protein E7604_06715 [Ruminococcaceae bacterium]|nr:hypothetical protein [Oscillospiraceae bacterium]
MLSSWRRAKDGALAIEGIIILTILIFFLVFLMGFGFLFYQQWLVVNTANDTAYRIAQSYAYPNTDPVMGFVNASLKSSLSPYRYIGSSLKDDNAEKGEKFAEWRLDATSFAYAVSEPEIHVETVYDAFAQRHIVVDIKATYEIPFGGALSFFGLKDTVTYHATGRAMIMDVSDYMYGVNTLNAITGSTLKSEIIKTVDSILGLINTIRDAMED